ncbi:MAG: DUF2069 domain-containing protein [Gammaproteobacteria bacterium]
MNKQHIYYTLTLLGYFGTMLIILAWYGWLAPPLKLSPAWVISLLVLPMFLVLRGLLHAKPRAVAWSLFLSFIYFTHGVVEAWGSTAARPWAIIEIICSLVWLIAGILFIRSKQSPL